MWERGVVTADDFHEWHCFSSVIIEHLQLAHSQLRRRRGKLATDSFAGSTWKSPHKQWQLGIFPEITASLWWRSPAQWDIFLSMKWVAENRRKNVKSYPIPFYNFAWIPTKYTILNCIFSLKKCPIKSLLKPKNTGHLEWILLGQFSEFFTNGDSKEALQHHL